MSKRNNQRRLHHQFETILGEKEIEPVRFRATQGDGTGTVKVEGKRNYVYVRRIGRSRIEECLNTRTSARDGLPVVIGYTHEMPDILQVLEVDWTGMSGLGDYVYLSAHHKSHEFMNSSGGDDVVWVQKQQVLPFLVHPTDPSSMYVDVFGGWYQWDDGWHYFEAAVSADLSGNVPAGGSGEARFVLIGIDGATEALVYTSGDVFPIFLPPPDREDLIPPPPSGVIPVAAICLSFGTTAIEWDNIYDIRLLFSGGGPMSVGAAPRDAAYVVLGLDPTLTAERVLVGGADVAIADGGAGGNATIDRSGNKILLFDSGANLLREYDAGSAGLIAALAAADAGDLVQIPPQTIALVVGISVPNGVTLAGMVQPNPDGPYPRIESDGTVTAIQLGEYAVLQDLALWHEFSGVGGVTYKGIDVPSDHSAVRRIKTYSSNTAVPSTNPTVYGICVGGDDGLVENVDVLAQASLGTAAGILMEGDSTIKRSEATANGTAAAVGIKASDGVVLDCWGDGTYGLQIFASGTVTAWEGAYSGTVDLVVDAGSALSVHAVAYDTVTINGTLTHLAGDRAGTLRDETITGDWNLNAGEMGLPSGGAFPGVPQEADVFYRTDEIKLYIYTGIEWREIGGGGGGGGGNPIFRCDGTLVVTANVNEAYVIASSVEIVAVYIHCGTLGTASSTIVDVNKNGVTVFTNQANRPTLAWNDADGVAKSGTPDITGLAENDVVTVDIDQTATGAEDLSVIIALAVTGSLGAGTIEIQEDDVRVTDASIVNFEGTGCSVTDEGGGKVTIDIPFSETAVRYSTNAGQSIPNTTITIIDFEDKVYDAASDVTTGANWHFTAPADGVYHVDASIMFTNAAWGAGQSILFFLYVGGVLRYEIARQYAQANITTYLNVAGSGDIKLSSSDTLDVRVHQSRGGATTFHTSNSQNWCNIHRVK